MIAHHDNYHSHFADVKIAGRAADGIKNNDDVTELFLFIFK